MLEVELMAFFRALFLSIVSILDEGVDGDIPPSIESPLVTDDTVDDGIAQYRNSMQVLFGDTQLVRTQSGSRIDFEGLFV